MRTSSALLLLGAAARASAGSPQCLGAGGKVVDWWFIYKAPSCVIPPTPGRSPLHVCDVGNVSVANYTKIFAAFYCSGTTVRGLGVLGAEAARRFAARAARGARGAPGAAQSS